MTNKLVSKIRTVAKNLKDGKEQASTSFFKVLGVYIKEVRHVGKAARFYAETADLVSNVLDKVNTDPNFNKQARSLVENIVNDFGSRVNEFANLVENVSADKDLASQVAKVKDSAEVFVQDVAARQEERNNLFGNAAGAEEESEYDITPPTPLHPVN